MRKQVICFLMLNCRHHLSVPRLQQSRTPGWKWNHGYTETQMPIRTASCVHVQPFNVRQQFCMRMCVWCVCDCVYILPSMYSIQLKPRTQFTFCCCLSQVAEGNRERERRAEREIKFSPLIKTETWLQSEDAGHFFFQGFIEVSIIIVSSSNTTNGHIRGI